MTTAKKTIETKALGQAECDITSLDQVQKSLNDFKPDLVVNAAAYTAVDKAEEDVELAFRINRDGAGNIAHVSGKLGIPMIHFSTDYVFDGKKTGPYLETDKVGPNGVYGQSKLEGEIAVAKANPQHIILRTAWVYSATGSNFLKTMLRLAADRDEVTIVADQFGNPSDAVDMAVGVHAIAEKYTINPDQINYGVFHFCGPERMNWADFARAIFEESRKLGGPFAEVRDIPTANYPTPAKRPANSSLNCDKFKTAYEYENLDFRSSVRSTIKALL